MSAPRTAAYDRLIARAGSGLYESHYIKANHPEGHQALWIKHNLLTSRHGQAVGEFWLVFFTRDAPPVVYKREVPLGRLRIAADCLGIDGDRFFFDGVRSRGQIADASWDVELSGGLPALWHFPYAAMYQARWPKKKIVTQAPNARLNGRVSVRGQDIELHDWIGLRAHNWGSEHAHTYAYGNCNLWDDKAADRTVDGFSARIRLGPVLSPWLSTLLYRGEGRSIDENGLRHIFNRRVQVSPTRWHLQGAALDLLMETDSARYAGLRYRHPDGRESYCYNTKMARVQLRVGDELYTSSQGELEVLLPHPLHGVRLHPHAGFTGAEDYCSEA